MNSRASHAVSARLTAPLLALEGVTKLVNCARGMSIYTLGDPGNSIYYLESGRIKILKRSTDDKEGVLAIISPGELFGERAIVEDHLREAYAEVLDEATVHVIPRDIFLGHCKETTEMWSWVLETFAKRQQDLEQRLALLIFYEVEQRILRSLEGLAAHADDTAAAEEGEWAVYLSHKELASLIGSTRETTSAALSELSKRGLIRLQRRRVVIPSIDKLRSSIALEIR
jgi:CRP/FNR family cyclic AMP-dependent transcriptional regulator